MIARHRQTQIGKQARLAGLAHGELNAEPALAVDIVEIEQPDIGLYNRVGDLYTRMGSMEEAVRHYEEAIDLYLESELPNNAIAVCKKIVRNMPMRHSVYLRMGQIRGRQGFVTDARQNFLIYAERMQAEGATQRSEAKAKQAGAHVKDAGRNARDAFTR